MPLYQYRCVKCETYKDLHLSITDDAPKYCTTCHTEMKRVYRIQGISFKGKGFYSTDKK